MVYLFELANVLQRCCKSAAFGSFAVETFDVLSDMEIRQGIKEFSNWPTIPQVYLNGEFLGGSDIMIEMYNSGELRETVTVALAS